MKSLHLSFVSALFVATLLALPAGALAATKGTVKAAPVKKLAPIEVYGWIPYWRSATGTADVLPNLPKLTAVSPFGFTMKNDGTLYDAAHITEEPWMSFIATAKQKKVKVIPTVMWANGEGIHRILSNAKTRVALEDEIAAMVKTNGFDGVDIDFEGKKAETKPYFSLFLKGLYQRLGKNKWLYCSIEARTPLSSRYDTIPKDIQYANDYAALNKYCDRVNIMTYDQGTVDLRLNAANDGPYVPVADPQWVEKVVKLAAQTIDKKKIRIGVATYGYEYSVTKLSEDGYRYDLQLAFNPRYGTELAQALGITPARNSAGELSFTYAPTSTPQGTAPPADPALSNNTTLMTTSFSDGGATTTPAAPPSRIVWWSDAKAVQDKIDLARKLGVRGVAVFKFDGGEDPNLWSTLK